MAGFLPVKMKRKDLEDVYDEFSEFSLSSPARKIRRLDAELPPIMEDEEPVAPMMGDEEPLFSLACNEQLTTPMESAVPSALNEERALVLYKPMNTPMLQVSSSSPLSFRVNTHLIPDLKSQVLRSGSGTVFSEAKDKEDSMDRERATTSNSLAVVPWVAPQYQHQVETALGTGDSVMGIGLSEPMEAEAADASIMEVEGGEDLGRPMGREEAGMGDGEGLQQWPQHCMTAQLPQNASTPIMWSW